MHDHFHPGKLHIALFQGLLLLRYYLLLIENYEWIFFLIKPILQMAKYRSVWRTSGRGQHCISFSWLDDDETNIYHLSEPCIWWWLSRLIVPKVEYNILIWIYFSSITSTLKKIRVNKVSTHVKLVLSRFAVIMSTNVNKQ